MRILHVVSLFTPDGAFGGPTRVAINQTRELRKRGHDVTLAGGAMGYGKQLPTEVDGVPVKLFPAYRLVPRTGFAGLTSPGLLAWFRHASKTADVVHIHLARDLLTLPVAVWARLTKIPYVLQLHGMVDTPSNQLARLLDLAATRNVLEHAGTVFCLNEFEEREVKTLTTRRLRTVLLPNGVPEAPEYTQPTRPEVLYLARLHARKRPAVFVEAALGLVKQYPDVHFSLVGPDEGEAPGIAAELDRHHNPPGIRCSGPLDPSGTLERLRACSVYVLPSVNEPFPMSVLEAMSVGKPVVITETCGLAAVVRETNSGLIVDHTTESLQSAIATLLDNPDLRLTMGSNARAAIRNRLGMANVVERLTASYDEAVSRYRPTIGSNPRRIVHYYARYLSHTSGVTDAINHWARLGADLGYEVEIWSAQTTTRGSSSYVDRKLHRTLPHTGKARTTWVPIGLITRLRRGDWLYLHEGWTISNLTAAVVGRLRGVTIVAMPHGVYEPGITSAIRDKWRLRARLEQVTLRLCHVIHVFYQGEVGVVEAFARGRAHFMTLPNGGPDPAQSPKWRGGGDFYVWMGRFDIPHKGIDNLLQFWARLPSPRPKLVLAGPDHMGGREEANRLIRELDLVQDITIQGHVSGDEKERLLTECRGYLHPSRWESCSITLLEFLSAGSPCMVSQSVHAAQALLDDGVVMTADFASWDSQSGQELLQALDRNTELSLRAHQWARAKGSWPAIGDRYERVLTAAARSLAR